MDRPEAASKPVEDARGTRAPSHGSSPSPPPDGGSEGRPAATPEKAPRHRTVHLSVRLFPEELERIRFAARARGLATSTFVRAASLGESLPAVRTGQEERDAAALLIQALPVLQGVLGHFERDGYPEAVVELEAGVGLVRDALGRLTT
jgi:hypothetical protein